MLESVQRKFSRRISSIRSLPYVDRLAELELEPLELRRLRFDLINYYKILNGFSPIQPDDHFLIYHPPSSSRSAMPYLQQPTRASSKLASSFFFRNIHVWNSLHCDLRAAPSVSSFKSALKKTNLKSFLKGNAFTNDI